MLKTLRRLESEETFSGLSETIVVDNASADGTARAVRERFEEVTVLALRRNLGSCAKAMGVQRARGRYIVFLDDDSYPRGGSVDRMIERFESAKELGASGFTVHLPDGRRECSAFPNVFVGCGVGFRAEALHAVGGLDAGFFMQGEEFDLSFRLVNAGWGVRVFEDLHVEHLKTPRARLSARTTYYDTRNNLLVVERYLTEPYRSIYRADWVRRYGWLAAANSHRVAFARGAAAGRVMGLRERRRFAGRRLRPAAFETLFRLYEVRSRMAELRRTGVRRVVLADMGKNVFAFYQGARECGLSVPAIADDRFALSGRRYREIPIVPTGEIASLNPDALVVSNTAPVHAETTRARLATAVSVPIHSWFDAGGNDPPNEFSSSDDSLSSENRCFQSAVG